MGTATIFAPQSIATARRSGMVRRILNRVGHWMFQSPETDQDVDHLNAELRHDVGLAPKYVQPQPFTGWQP